MFCSVRRFKQCVVLLQLQLNRFKRYDGLLIWRKRVYRVCVKNKAYALTLIYIARKKNTAHTESETKCKSTDQNENIFFIAEKWFSLTKDENEIKSVCDVFGCTPLKSTKRRKCECLYALSMWMKCYVFAVLMCVKWKQAIKFSAFLNCTWKTLEVDLHCTSFNTRQKYENIFSWIYMFLSRLLFISFARWLFTWIQYLESLRCNDGRYCWLE